VLQPVELPLVCSVWDYFSSVLDQRRMPVEQEQIRGWNLQSKTKKKTTVFSCW